MTTFHQKSSANPMISNREEGMSTTLTGITKGDVHEKLERLGLNDTEIMAVQVLVHFMNHVTFEWGDGSITVLRQGVLYSIRY